MATVRLTEYQKSLLIGFPFECNVGTGKNTRIVQPGNGRKRTVSILVKKNILMEIVRGDGSVGYCLTTLGMSKWEDLHGDEFYIDQMSKGDRR